MEKWKFYLLWASGCSFVAAILLTSLFLLAILLAAWYDASPVVTEEAGPVATSWPTSSASEAQKPSAGEVEQLPQAGEAGVGTRLLEDPTPTAFPKAGKPTPAPVPVIDPIIGQTRVTRFTVRRPDGSKLIDAPVVMVWAYCFDAKGQKTGPPSQSCSKGSKGMAYRWDVASKAASWQVVKRDGADFATNVFNGHKSTVRNAYGDVFRRLQEVGEGDELLLRLASGEVLVYEYEGYDLYDLTDSQLGYAVNGKETSSLGTETIAAVTCGGQLDAAGRYLQRRVVYFRPKTPE